MRGTLSNKNTVLAGLMALFFLASCEKFQDLTVTDNTPATEIFAEADKYAAKDRGTKAGDYYMEIERYYPFTPEAERALILAAQAYHDDGALTESRVAAERYLQFFPGGPNAAQATYLVALSYYDGIRDVSRDQSRTFEALQALQDVMDKYPETQYAKLAAPKFTIALDQLAGKEMSIGRYYLAQANFVAARNRFQAVLDEYPENNHKPEAYHRLIETYLAMGLRSEVARVFAEEQAAYPTSAWTKRSAQLVKTGVQKNAGASSIRQIFTGSFQ